MSLRSHGVHAPRRELDARDACVRRGLARDTVERGEIASDERASTARDRRRVAVTVRRVDGGPRRRRQAQAKVAGAGRRTH